MVARGHAAPAASAGPASALRVAEEPEGSPLEVGDAELAAVVVVAPKGERGAPVVATVGPPSNLAALSRSQRELLPGVTPSRRRWHSSHGHLPSGPISSPDMQWAWVRNPQSGHFLPGPLFAEPCARSSPKHIGHHN